MTSDPMLQFNNLFAERSAWHACQVALFCPFTLPNYVFTTMSRLNRMVNKCHHYSHVSCAGFQLEDQSRFQGQGASIHPSGKNRAFPNSAYLLENYAGDEIDRNLSFGKSEVWSFFVDVLGCLEMLLGFTVPSIVHDNYFPRGLKPVPGPASYSLKFHVCKTMVLSFTRLSKSMVYHLRIPPWTNFSAEISMNFWKTERHICEI